MAVVSNTVKRVEKMSAELLRLAESDAAVPEVLSVLGIAQFMESQSSGRSGALLMKRIRAALLRPPTERRAALPELLEALRITFWRRSRGG